MQFAVQVVDTGLARGGAIASGVDACDRKATSLERGHLVFHQGDQRADDQSRASARDGGKLVAETLAGAGGHDKQHVPALHRGLADGFLIGAERCEAEGTVEEVRPAIRPCAATVHRGLIDRSWAARRATDWFSSRGA